jgi:hypothetical protein
MPDITQETMSTQNVPGAGEHRIRASDEEREQIAHILRTAMTEGRLNLEDGEERLAAAYAATFREDLTPLTADLPGGGRHALAHTPEAMNFARRHLRRHAGTVVLVALILVGLWVLSGAAFFWPAIPLAFLAFGLMARVRFYRFARSAGSWPAGRWQAGRWPGGPGGRRGPNPWR